MNHLFVSYSRKDEAAVRRVVSALKEKGYPIWQDTSGPASGIPFSTKWFDIIEEAIYSASGAFIFDSENWRASVPCQDEYKLLQKTGNTETLMVIDTAEIDKRFEEILQEAEDFIKRIRKDPGYSCRTQVFSAAYAMKNGADPYQLVERHNGIRSGFRYMLLIITMFFQRDDLKDYDPAFFPYIDRYLKFAMGTAVRRFLGLILGLVLAGTIGVYALSARNELHQGGFRQRSSLNDYSAIRSMQDLRYKDTVSAVDVFNDTHAFVTIMDTVNSIVANAVQLQNTELPAIVSLEENPACLRVSTDGSSADFQVSFSAAAGSLYLENLQDHTRRSINTPSPVTCYAWNHDGAYLAYACGNKVFILCPSAGTPPMRLSESIYPLDTLGFYEIEGKEMIGGTVQDSLAVIYDIPFENSVISSFEVSAGTLAGTSADAAVISDGSLYINRNNTMVQIDSIFPEKAQLQEMALYRDVYLAFTYTCSNEAHLQIYDLRQETAVHDIAVPKQMKSIVFSDDGSFLFGYSENALSVISCADGTVKSTETDTPVLAICPYGEGAAVYTGTEVRLIDRNLKSKRKNSYVAEQSLSGSDFVMISSGKDIYIASGSGSRYISFDHISLEEKKYETIIFDAYQDYAGITAVSASKDGQYVLFGYADGSVRIFQDHGQYMIYEDRPISEKMMDLQYDPDTGNLLILSASGRIFRNHISLPALNVEYTGTMIDSLQNISNMLVEKCNVYYQGIIE